MHSDSGLLSVQGGTWESCRTKCDIRHDESIWKAPRFYFERHWGTRIRYSFYNDLESFIVLVLSALHESLIFRAIIVWLMAEVWFRIWKWSDLLAMAVIWIARGVRPWWNTNYTQLAPCVFWKVTRGGRLVKMFCCCT